MDILVDTVLFNFEGFYGSLCEGEIDNCIENEIEYFEEEFELTNLTSDDFFIQYQDIFKGIAEDFTNFCNNIFEETLPFPVKATFRELWSPKFYNYTNDKILVDLEVDINQLIHFVENYAKKPQLKELLKENFTHRDGFLSYHSPWLSDWLMALKQRDSLKDFDVKASYLVSAIVKLELGLDTNLECIYLEINHETIPVLVAEYLELIVGDRH